ncbi:hypothetical protein ES705_13478 [subsurface metagenome]
MQGIEQLIKMQGIEQLIKKGFSLIPLQRNSRVPIERFSWKQFQYKRASIKEVFGWYRKFGDINLGIVCGSVSRLAGIDADDKNQLPTLEEVIPELWLTTRVKTPKAGRYHFYFSTNGDKVKSTSKLLGLSGIELKSEGTYVVAPGSVVDGVRYGYERSLRELKPLPKIIIEDVKTVIPGNIEVPKDNRLPVYRGQASCIGQIAREDIPRDTVRNTALLILFNKLIEAGNSKGYAKYFIIKKNSQLTVPLPKKDINFDKADIYHYSCSRINRELNFVDCSNCQVRGGFKVSSIAMKSIHKIDTLTTSERSILLVLDTYFRGESPSAYEVSKFIKNSNQHTIKNALEVLKKKGII